MIGKKTWLGLAILTMCLVAIGVSIVRPWESRAADLATVRAQRLSGIRADLARSGLTLGQPILIRIF